MKKAKLRRLKQIGFAVVGAYVITGCPSMNATTNATSNLLKTDSSPAQDQAAQAAETSESVTAETITSEAIIPEASASEASASEASAVEFEVCAAVDDWQRPSDADQDKQLGSDGRYNAALEDDELKRASDRFWNYQAISFTTYGLSARMEPINLSGVWTAAEDLWNCYEPETTVAINDGDLAETWLLNHQITSLQWESDRYVMTVEPTATGMQVVQFDRMDNQLALPLEIVTTSGSAVEVTSGDWQ
ncbi:MAG: hypothetical protein WA883_18165 [Phormidesmis sp.]